jgi:hypothetical protein
VGVAVRVLTAEHVRVPDHEAVNLRVRDSATLGLVMVRRAAWRARRSVFGHVCALVDHGLDLLAGEGSRMKTSAHHHAGSPSALSASCADDESGSSRSI